MTILFVLLNIEEYFISDNQLKFKNKKSLKYWVEQVIDFVKLSWYTVQCAYYYTQLNLTPNKGFKN